MNKIQNNGARKLMATALVFAIALALGACEDLPFGKMTASRSFVIRTGEHYASPRLYETFKSSRLPFKATFDESAKYTFDDPAMQSNKFLGFSDCNAQHHVNSARFAWQWFNDRLETNAYCYTGGVRIEKFIGTVNPGEENLYEVVATDREYVFYLNGERTESVVRASSCPDGVNYMLYPYLGGAPHDVTIKIEVVS